MKRHKFSTLLLATALGLLLPATSHAQFIGFPIFGNNLYGNSRNMYALTNRSYFPIASPYMNPGLSAFSGTAGYGMGSYNPLLYNASFNPTVYNPTPAVYNPAVYNAAFNPGFGQTGLGAYAINGGSGSGGTKPAVGEVPSTTERIRPDTVRQSLRSSRIQILLPTSDTEVSLQGVRTKQTGTDRMFRTPPLSPNDDYSYEVVVRWRDASGNHAETRRVRFWGGQDVLIDFRTGS